MGLFDATHQLFKEIQPDLDTLMSHMNDPGDGMPYMSHAIVYDEGDKGESVATLAAGKNNKADVLAKATEFCGQALAAATHNAFERTRQPQMIGYHLGDEPNELHICLNRGVPALSSPRVPVHGIWQELARQERLVFKGWEEVRVEAYPDVPYLAKHFATADDRKLAATLVIYLAKAYGLEEIPMAEFDNDHGKPSLAVRKDFMIQLANHEQTLEADFDMPKERRSLR